MSNRIQFVLVMVGSMTLMACGNDEAQPGGDETQVHSAVESAANPDSRLDQSGESADRPTAALLEDPEALRDAMRDPEQREVLMQAMRERRQARREDTEEPDRDAMRERMRQRREELMANRDSEPGNQRPLGRMSAQAEWWQDETLSESLALNESQIQALNARNEALNSRRTEARQQLAVSQRELMIALEAVDRERMMALIEQRSTANQELQQAELDWWRTLLEQLDDEQLSTLARDHPQVLTGRRR